METQKFWYQIKKKRSHFQKRQHLHNTDRKKNPPAILSLSLCLYVETKNIPVTNLTQNYRPKTKQQQKENR